MTIVHYAIPFFFLTLAAEYFAVRNRVGLKGHEKRDTAASLAMGVGSLFTSAAAIVPEVAAYQFLYEYRIFDLPNAWWVWPLLIIAEDHSYYWFHRMHHESRILWAGHVTHHSSEHYNLSTALRQSWTTQFTGIPFWLPLPILGFAPEQILVAKSISLLYQYWIHTESIRSLGPFEWIFNTPSHHRVHHATNPLYLDRNHGGILIIWDRLYGTFEPEHEKPRYGILSPLETFNPVKIAFHEWVDVFRDVRKAKTFRGALKLIFGPPGHREDGTGLTSVDLRRLELERRARGEGDESPPSVSSGDVSNEPAHA